MKHWLHNSCPDLVGTIAGANIFMYAYDGIGSHVLHGVNLVTNRMKYDALNQRVSVLGALAPPRELSYAADGGLANDGRFAYAYDAEDRLVSATSLAPTGGAVRVRNEYDWRSRRVAKCVDRYDADAEAWRPAERHDFAWDNWNIVHETVSTFAGAATNVTEVQYFWGPDLSGTLDGAGGVGGLLAVSFNGSFYFPVYDNNGNVMKYVDESGDVVASYIYDDFGRIIAQAGPLADTFAFGFSTKYLDRETDMVAYQRRFYRPDWGCWLNRDPIAEENGDSLYGLILNQKDKVDCPNLYSFIENNPLSQIDLLGLEKVSLSYDFASDSTWFDRIMNWSTQSGLTVSQADNDIQKRINPYGKSGKGACKCIRHVILAGHGYEGEATFGGGDRNILTANFMRMARDGRGGRYIPIEIMSLLQTIKNLSCEEMTVEFATCLSGRGDAGVDLQTELESFFGSGVNVILYAREIKFYFNKVH